MAATSTQHVPVIPPRPARAQDKASMPTIPPRPNKRLERTVSPNPDRFAPSPLNDVRFASKGQGGLHSHHADPIDRSKSVELPTLGQEGQEYDSMAEELGSNPEHTRTVGADLKLHAPKPSWPAVSAKQRVMAVTRTDSDRAASFGIGKPSAPEAVTSAPAPGRSLKKKPSTASQTSHTESHFDEEQGIPEIGKQVPMYPNAGDVQAPSPAPGMMGPQERPKHTRKASSRGANLLPDCYGLHGHGVAPQDKLEKAYYEKHPDLLKAEHPHHHFDRPNDFSMSSEDLNKIVRDTASRGRSVATRDYTGTPSEQVGWQAMEESTSHAVSPRPGSATSTDKRSSRVYSSGSAVGESEHGDVIHIDEPWSRKSVLFNDMETPEGEEGRPYSVPILAEDEVAKDPEGYEHAPAVELPPDRTGSSLDLERPGSARSSRPASLFKEASYEKQCTPLDDVEEYEPLFPEDDKGESMLKTAVDKIKNEHKRRFPSQDVWEDAPNSVHYTAEVSTPELIEDVEQSDAPTTASVHRQGGDETLAHAFARRQEELAELESRQNGPDGFIPNRNKSTKPSPSVWVQHQPHLASEVSLSRPTAHRFPSQDVWEDTPDSLKLETTVSKPQQEPDVQSPIDTKPEHDMSDQPQRTKAAETSLDAAVESDKPSIPSRPKPRTSSDDKPTIPERPKPHVPARPSKAAGPAPDSSAAESAPAPRAKPAVPARPMMGSKIAALQAGFMSDLNNRLRLGPQASTKKKEEEEGASGAAEEKQEEKEKEKVPLNDARKGRARGPQRRAPAAAKSSSPLAVSVEVADAKPPAAASFAVSVPCTFFEIDPQEDTLVCGIEKKNSAAVEGAALAAVSAPAPAPPVEAVVEERKEEVAKEEEEKQGDKAEVAPLVHEEVKTLATNMAGEAVVEERIEKDDAKEEVRAVGVEEH